ncbi:MAG TPA: hypothetical protein VLF69_05295 [Candidatus Saccharimonadales bacterium]|nr:hypothetical protein [Candidatus Saccharimonadales bacterium]
MKRILPWLTAATIIVITFGTIGLTVQQTQRSEANSPQIQLAEDAAAQLDRGVSPDVITLGSIDLNHSLSPFIAVYSKSGQPMGSSGQFGKDLPRPPLGVLQAANGHEYHAVTWQPTKGLRFATVAVAAKDYYVLSGRSLHEVERNESMTYKLVGLALLLSLTVLAVAAYILVYPTSRKR